MRIPASLQVDIVPSQGEISVGESKFFLCQVAGEARSKDISWFSPNGERLSPGQQRISVVRNDDSSSTLTIYNANIDDAGIYKCVVSSPEEGDSEATVNVKIFRKKPSGRHCPYLDGGGGDLDGVQPAQGAVPVDEVGGCQLVQVRFIVLSNNYLQIRGIKKTDEGTYRCEGRILARGEINFKDIQVIVNVPPSVRARQSTMNATANLSQSVTLACDADGFPEPTVSWTKDGEPVEEVEEEEDKYSFNSDGSELVIHRVDKSDEAEYICIAENKAGEADATIHLKVFAKPKITYVENKTAMELEDQITLTCEASGDPIPSITWRSSSRNISSEEKASWTRPEKQETLDGRIVVRSHARVSSLTLKDIQYTDAGEYICTASNTIGQDSQAMYLEVQYAPKLQGPVAVYTWEGNRVNITCEVFAYPSAVISWFRDGQLLPSSNYSNIKIYNTPSASYLEVTPDSENDFGNYNCTAVNRIGQESSEFILVQADTPSSPSIGRVEPYSSSAQVEFEEPEATGGVPILRYKAEWRALGEGDWHSRLYDAKEANVEGTVTITGLKPETTYAVRLSAVNGKGVGELSPPAEFKTQPVRIPHPPTPAPAAASLSPVALKGEPSAPKLEGHIGEDGNSIKVNVIKQDDGGSPIRHYLIKYKAKHSSEWKPEIRLPSGSDHVMLKSLDWNADYEVYVVAENQQGKSKPAHYAFRTSAQPTVIPASTSPASGLGTAAIIGILVVVFVALLVAVDVTCYFLNKCGLLMCIAVNLCGKSGPGAKGKDMEEGKAAFSKDESKEPIVEVRTEEERTPNHDGGKHTEPNETTPLTEPDPSAADAVPAGSKAGTPGLTSPAAPNEAKQEVAKSPEKEPVQPSTVKSPAETPKNPSNAKSEAAAGSAANPSQNEDFKMDEGTFKPPDIDLAKDVFAALGTASPPAASGAGGQAPEAAAAAADSSAPAKTEKMPAEDKGAVQDRKSPAAEVKTVPNEATQTKESESKA
ncbi:neural cell adhesion molecule 1 [Geospiza fortis]|uniref:Neural cell adhesion molecule 1 n=1 Tax=Geospiza fortis TaxID=48883 RepID=A0A8N5I2Q8_GEOFO|nr:neural cell adhesion molecule 1 [Geospiza fortis]